MISPDLSKILRCPNCVRNGPDAGQLEYTGNWFICCDCDRKYPVYDDIPVMLIEAGEEFQNVPREELPKVPPPQKNMPSPEIAQAPSGDDERKKLILMLLGLAAGIGLAVLLVVLFKKKKQ